MLIKNRILNLLPSSSLPMLEANANSLLFFMFYPCLPEHLVMVMTLHRLPIRSRQRYVAIFSMVYFRIRTVSMGIVISISILTLVTHGIGVSTTDIGYKHNIYNVTLRSTQEKRTDIFADMVSAYEVYREFCSQRKKHKNQVQIFNLIMKLGF